MAEVINRWRQCKRKLWVSVTDMKSYLRTWIRIKAVYRNKTVYTHLFESRTLVGTLGFYEKT